MLALPSIALAQDVDPALVAGAPLAAPQDGVVGAAVAPGPGIAENRLAVPAEITQATPADVRVAETGTQLPNPRAPLRNSPVLAVDFAAGLLFEDNRDEENEFEISARVGLSYFTSTTNQRLSYDIGITGEINEDTIELTDPSANFSYAVFNRQTEVSIDLSFAEIEIDGADLDDDFDADDVDDTDGERQDIDLRFGLVTGRDRPFGTITELTYNETNFSGGSNQDDEWLVALQTTLRFTIDPRIEFRLIGAVIIDEEDDVLESRDTITRVTAETDLLINPVWSATVGLGFAQRESETILGEVDDDAIEARLVLSRDMRNGSLLFSADRTLNTEDVRETYSVTRALTLAHGAEAAAQIGFTRFEGGDITPLASFDYNLPLADGNLTFAASFEGDIDDDDDERIERAQVSVGFNQDLTRVSSWSIDGALASVTSDTDDDTLRADLGLSYLHALTADWNLATRLSHQVIFEDGDVDDSTSIISVSLERRFVFRP